MHFRRILSGTLAVLLVSSVAVPSSQASGLLGIFDRSKPAAEQPPVQLAQADPRVNQLEEQIRALNGKVEELNFQILQMQEQMRKMQEDNDFRFQELEKKQGSAGPAKDRKVAGAPVEPAKPADAAAADGKAQEPAQADTSLAEIPAGQDQGAAVADQGNGTGAPPKDFGTITVDKDGNVTSSTAEQPIDLTPNGQNGAGQNAAQPPPAGVDVAALPRTDNPDELYRNSYQSILSGDYSSAEAGFRDHIKRFPSDAKVSDSNYWLGESLLGQQKYRDAAEVFLNASKQYPKAKKAPDMLLKLGVSLVGLNQKDVGCATFSEIGKRYPNASDAMKQRVKQEQALAAC